ncbi:hypothetical protein B0T21DRAFT_411930 [Apiosordaria backusii]|uniref:RNase H type-1 domain-containing protein n=1 Tax=Apiosordaria backusii TaxID=314023 RepID=A0AA40BM51_9PEZI|nr:hypothetical protein B0T21DRAFT_411930 [Apiosordaria backusii]
MSTTTASGGEVRDSAKSAEIVDISGITSVIVKEFDAADGASASASVLIEAQPESPVSSEKKEDVVVSASDESAVVSVHSGLGTNVNTGDNMKDIPESDSTDGPRDPPGLDSPTVSVASRETEENGDMLDGGEVPDTGNVQDDKQAKDQKKAKKAKAALVIKRAETCDNHSSTPENFRISIFCDGSADPTGDLDGIGGYAITFNRYRPDTEEHGDRVGLAWPMDIALSSTSSEVTAVFEAVCKVEQELTEAFTSGDIPKDKLPRDHIIVDIYTDSEGTVITIEETRKKVAAAEEEGKVFGYPGNTTLVRRVALEVVKQEKNLQRLCDQYNVSIEVNYHWLPGHSGVKGNHDVDALCGKARKENGAVFSVNGRIQPSMPSKYLSSYSKIFAHFLKAKSLTKVRKQAKLARKNVTKGVTALKATIKSGVRKAGGQYRKNKRQWKNVVKDVKQEIKQVAKAFK